MDQASPLIPTPPPGEITIQYMMTRKGEEREEKGRRMGGEREEKGRRKAQPRNRFSLFMRYGESSSRPHTCT